MNKEIVINDDNFNDYFFEVATHKPQKGQIMAQFRAVADLVDGEIKRNIISMLMNVYQGGLSAPKIMKKICGATEKDSVRVCREIAQDLLSGMEVDAVAAKLYRFDFEKFYYVNKEFVPKDNPNWSIISLIAREKSELA